MEETMLVTLSAGAIAVWPIVLAAVTALLGLVL